MFFKIRMDKLYIMEHHMATKVNVPSVRTTVSVNLTNIMLKERSET